MYSLDELRLALAALQAEGNQEEARIVQAEIDRLEGQVAPDEIPTPMEQPIGPSVTQERPEFTAGQKAIGAIDALAALGIGAFTGTAGMTAGALRGLAEAILSGQYGTEEGARLVEQYASQYAEAATPTPFTGAGRETLRDIAEPLSQLPPVLGTGPVGPQLARSMGRQARDTSPAYARAAEQADAAATAARQSPLVTGMTERAGALTERAGAAATAVKESPLVTGIAERAGALAERFDPRRMPELTREEIALSESLGVPVPTRSVFPAQTAPGKIAQGLAGQIPTGPSAFLAKITEAGVKGVEGLAKLDDEIPLPREKEALEAYGQAWNKARGNKVGVLTKKKNDIVAQMDDSGPMPMDNLRYYLNNEIKNQTEIGRLDLARDLEELKADFVGKDIYVVNEKRKDVRDRYVSEQKKAILGPKDEIANRAYSEIRKDLTEFVNEKGSPELAQQWNNANKGLKDLADDLAIQVVNRAWKNRNISPIQAGKLLFNFEDPAVLRTVFKRMDGEARTKAEISIVARAYEKAAKSGEVNSVTFADEMRLLMKAIGMDGPQTEVLQRAEGLARAIDMTKSAKFANVAPPTGQQGLGFVAGSWLTDMVGGGPAALGIGLTFGALARIYESKPVRNVLMRLNKTPKGSRQEELAFDQLVKLVAKEVAKVAPRQLPTEARLELKQLQELEEPKQ